VEVGKRREAMLELIDDVSVSHYPLRVIVLNQNLREEEDEDFKEWAEGQERRGGHKVEVSTAVLAPLTYKPAPSMSLSK
jgi:hypothetical protein